MKNTFKLLKKNKIDTNKDKSIYKKKLMIKKFNSKYKN